MAELQETFLQNASGLIWRWYERFLGQFFCDNNCMFVLWLLSTLICCVAFPVVTVLEFWKDNPSDPLYIVKLYPHMLLYPPVVLWAVLWSVGSAVAVLWRDGVRLSKRGKPLLSLLAALVVAAIFTGWELTRDHMMLFELSPKAKATVNDVWPDTTDRISRSKIYERATALLRSSSASSTQIPRASASTPDSKLIDKYLQPQYWNGQMSWSRWLYALTFFIFLFAVVSTYLLVAYIPARGSTERPEYIKYLFIAGIGLAIWVLPRIYYDTQIKAKIFALASAVPPEDFFYSAALVLFGVFLARAVPEEADRAKSIAAIVALIAAPVLGFLTKSQLEYLIGLKSTWMMWLFCWILFCLSLFVGFAVWQDD